MRIAPIGLTFRHATDPELQCAVAHAVFSSHIHHEAIDAAAVLARAVAFAALCRPPLAPPPLLPAEAAAPAFAPAALLDALAAIAATPAVRARLGGAGWAAVVWTMEDDDDSEAAAG